MLGPEARGFAQASLSAATLRCYSPAVLDYQEWCRSNQLDDSVGGVNPVSVASWMGWLAIHRTIKASTIEAYSSAVCTWHKWGTLSDGLEIGRSTAVSLVRAGIKKAKKPEEKAAAAAAERPADVTPKVLAKIVAVAPGTSDHAVMCIAAASVALYGQLRPGELLGSRQHRDRALRLSQVIFWRDADQLESAPVGRSVRDMGPTPHHFTIDLGVTKADQLADNEPYVVAADPAVEALWNWLHLRAERRTPSENIFTEEITRKDGERVWSPLAMAELLRQLTAWAAIARIDHRNFKGKSFRRGGAAALMEAGAPADLQMAAGRWKVRRMPQLYAGPLPTKIRKSKDMAPAQPSARR